jgi:ribonuclease HI
VKEVVIYSDGACEGNPGPGGWAAVLINGQHQKEISGAEPATTNNRMELKAALKSLLALKEPCQVEFHTDSEYLREGITQWIHGWKKRGWKTKDKKAVKNEDLWRALDSAAAPHTLNWHWVKGHSGNLNNERCDRLAVLAIEKLKKSLGPQELASALEAFKQSQLRAAAVPVSSAQLETPRLF